MARIRHRIGMGIMNAVGKNLIRTERSNFAILIAKFVLATMIAVGSMPAEAQRPAAGCKAPDAVCVVSAVVFPISSYLPVASAVLIGPELLVTNRHVIADRSEAEVFMSDGSRRTAEVIPTSYPGDLVLLQATGLVGKQAVAVQPAKQDLQVYAIGADIGRAAIRVYVPGKVSAPPKPGKPLARVHHSARMLPSNSGGALVSRSGKLVAIISSGGEGRNEAIPASEIEKLKGLSGASHDAAHNKIGAAYRSCMEMLNEFQSNPARRLTPSDVEALYMRCVETGNRQLYDDAGRVLGRQRYLDQALDLFQRSLDQDPNGLNTRLSMAITLHVAQRYKEEIPHLEELMATIPSDPQVLRLAIQAGKWGGDDAVADRAFDLLVEHHPQLKASAERFMKIPPPSPAGVSPR